MSVRSQYPAAQSRPQRPDWRVSLTTQERPRRPSSLGSRAEPSRMGRLAAPAGSLRAPQGTPGQGLQGPPRAEMAPPGAGTSGSKHSQGASASWGCVPVPPTRRPRLSGPRLGSGGLASHTCSCAQVPTRLRLGYFLLVVPTSHFSPPLHSPLWPGDLPPRGPRPPALRELGLSACAPGSAGKSEEVTRHDHRAPSAAGRGGQPAPAVSLDGMAGSQCARFPYPAAPLPARSARVFGLAPLPPPFWLVISSPPRSACQARTAHLCLGAQPSRLPFFPGR